MVDQTRHLVLILSATSEEAVGLRRGSCCIVLTSLRYPTGTVGTGTGTVGTGTGVKTTYTTLTTVSIYRSRQNHLDLESLLLLILNMISLVSGYLNVHVGVKRLLHHFSHNIYDNSHVV